MGNMNCLLQRRSITNIWRRRVFSRSKRLLIYKQYATIFSCILLVYLVILSKGRYNGKERKINIKIKI